VPALTIFRKTLFNIIAWAWNVLIAALTAGRPQVPGVFLLTAES
jgi:hypothetical protein